MIITRKDVIKLLEENGLTEKIILDYINKYKNQVTSYNNKFYISRGIKLDFNTTLAEKPINIVIKKELLGKYAKEHKIYPLNKNEKNDDNR